MIECNKCSEANDDSSVNCKRCGAALEQTNASSSVDWTSTPILTLKDTKTGKEIVIKNSCLIGREGDIDTDYFSTYMHVSRRHCNVTLDKNEYKIEHLSQVTPTKVNNRDIGKGLRQVVRNGDTLTIADIEFKVSVAVPVTVAPETVSINSSNQEAVQTIKKFVITCPKCGKKYEVKDINEKIKECDECDDYDKEEIVKIKAEEITENAN